VKQTLTGDKLKCYTVCLNKHFASTLLQVPYPETEKYSHCNWVIFAQRRKMPEIQRRLLRHEKRPVTGVSGYHTLRGGGGAEGTESRRRSRRQGAFLFLSSPQGGIPLPAPRGLGSVASFPSGVRAGNPAEIKYCTISM